MIFNPGKCLFFVSAAFIATAVEGQTSRPFQMASTAIQGYQQNQGVIFGNAWTGFTFRQLSPDVDLISVQPEYLGVPFAQFAKSSVLAPGDPWAQQMIVLADSAKGGGKPLMVQIVLVRENMVGNAVYPDGEVEVQPYWAPACPDLTTSQYSTIEQSYVNYALWVARTFSPRYFVIMQEPNLYYAACGGNTPSWQLLVKIEQDVYNALRNVYPSMILFPSFNLEAIYGLGSIYGQDPTQFDQAQYDSLLAMKRDRLGLTSFPEAIQNPYQIPSDYYTRILTKNPNEPRVVITETGWNSASIDVYVSDLSTCGSRYSDSSFEQAFLNFLIYSAYEGNFDVVTWWSDRDEIPATVVSACYPVATPPSYPECNGDVWCAATNAARTNPPPGIVSSVSELAFKAFGSLGLRAYDGTPKSGLLTMWQKYQQLPLTPTESPVRLPRGKR